MEWPSLGWGVRFGQMSPFVKEMMALLKVYPRRLVG